MIARVAVALLFLLLSFGPAILHAQPAPTSPDDLKTFTDLQQSWAEARKARDVVFLERFYAPEFSVGTMDGGESTRAQDLAMFSTGDLHPAVITDHDLRVLRYGNAALVTGVEHLEGSYKGHNGAFDVRFSNVYVQRNGRWQLVRHQAAQIQPR